jgi:uncharacterized membrane protein YeaQ/YmgE (transglycosylase-associated protein family)
MEWTVTNVWIQIICGIVGGHIAATITKEHNFGAIGHTVGGAIGGGISGYFFQSLAATMVTETGSQQPSRLFDQYVIQALTGAIAGGIAVLLVGLIRHSIDHHKSQG